MRQNTDQKISEYEHFLRSDSQGLKDMNCFLGKTPSSIWESPKYTCKFKYKELHKEELLFNV